MYCPNCDKEYTGKFCPECGTKLIERPAQPGGFNLNLGDANAISGGVHLSDSHNVHNEDKSVHTITNTTSNVTNITQVVAQKTDIEILQEKKAVYLNECKRAFEDNVLEQSEVVALEECRIRLGLDKSTAEAILESVRSLSERNARKTELNPIARTKLKILTENLQKNDVNALIGQIDSFEALVHRFYHDELTCKYYMVLAALKSDKCITQYESTKIDNYWNAFWSYLAYIKEGHISEAEDILASLDRFTSYPEDNITVLATGGAIIMGDKNTAKELLSAITGEYTLVLQHFVDSIYFLLDSETAKEMGADENSCAFYLVNFFGQKDSNDKTEQGCQKGIDEESMSSQEMYDVGESFYYGKDGKTQDYVEAVKWFRKAAEQGNVNAFSRLGVVYALGHGVSKNLDEALYWYRKTEKCGDKRYKGGYYYIGDSWCGLGDDYYNGEDGKPQDFTEAAKWYRKSAELGCHSRSILNLGVCYAKGQGVNKDSTEALKWFKKAAEPGPTWSEGDSRAQFIVGLYYEYGDGVPKDIEEALKWYKKAAEGGDSDAKEKLKKYE